MEMKNYDDLTDKLKWKGLGDKFNDGLKQAMKEGVPEYKPENTTTIQGDEVRFRPHFRREKDNDKYHLNGFDVAILNAPDGVREHYVTDSRSITAMEAYRMVKHGELVAVNKDLYTREGEKYNIWISLNIKGQKDEYGKYPENTFHENYFARTPFNIQEALKNTVVPVKELENPQKLEEYERKLKKAELIAVTIYHEGKEGPGFLSVNPEDRDVDVLDANQKLIPRQEQKTVIEHKNEQGPRQDDSEKKKTGVNQQDNNGNNRNWQKKNYSKGVSR